MKVTRIYVGNLPFSTTEDDVRGMFEAYGAVHEVSLIERSGNRPITRLWVRGYGRQGRPCQPSRRWMVWNTAAVTCVSTRLGLATSSARLAATVVATAVAAVATAAAAAVVVAAAAVAVAAAIAAAGATAGNLRQCMSPMQPDRIRPIGSARV